MLALPISAEPEVESVTLRGTVVELTDALGKLNLKADAEPIARQVVLREEDGTISPLLADDASRALFDDERLRERPAEIDARRIAGLPYLQVTSVPGRGRW